MSLSDLTDMMSSYLSSSFRPAAPNQDSEEKYVYLLTFSDKPYTQRVWSDVEKVIEAANLEVEGWKEEKEDEGLKFLEEEEIEKTIREMNGGHFEYLAYSRDYAQAIWVSKCSLT